MTKIPSVEDYSIDITSDLAGVLPSALYDKLEERTIKGLTDQRLALLTELRDSGLLEEKPELPAERNWKRAEEIHRLEAHNTLAKAIKAHLDELIKSTSV
jgi:hypothetical protein